SFPMIAASCDGKTKVAEKENKEPVKKEDSKKALKEAKSKGVKNIIFNVTLNGGGYIGAAYEIMGFLTDKPLKVWTYNPLSGEKKIEIIKSKKPKYN
ncbi:S41 family peptidase, partial [Mycoplasmopsis bovis]|uniref:S41 family peptidase n=1 Tax=Mycoplasmopsis bovis TaxID=28903 RepID=UPI003D265F27